MNIVVSIQLLTTLYQVSNVFATYGEWGEWGKWSSCSVTCGYGSVTRNRNWIFPNGTVYRNFTYSYTLECETNSPCPTHGGWSMWTAWNSCTLLCGNGTMTRTRLCNSPKPTSGGMPCNGSDVDQRFCNERICPELPKDFNMSTCNESTFKCDSGLQCVSMVERCDDEAHCHDGSDEKDCMTYLTMNSNGDTSGTLTVVIVILLTLFLHFLVS